MYLSASTIDKAGFVERLDAATAGGYAGIGLRPSHYAKAVASGLADGDIRALLAGRGLEVIEIGFLADWWEAGDRAAGSRAHEEELYDLKERVGGRHMMLISGPLVEPLDVIAERFASVCDRAADHGLRVGLEFLPWTDTHDAEKAWRIADLAGRPNGGVVLDTWHHFRGGGTSDMIRAIPAERIVTIQISDGEFERVDTDLADTFKRRQLPGDGEFDLGGFVALVEGLGVTAPVGVEVLSDRLRALPPTDLARQAAEATRRVLRVVA
jgi:sugar phosphate isomerase/epimerase